MRLLHTSDWHLGRSFHREDLLGAQAAFVDCLVDVVRAERVDAVLVSGDVYDRALPSVDAVALCDEALAPAARTGARVVLISGNHDSRPAARLRRRADRRRRRAPAHRPGGGRRAGRARGRARSGRGLRDPLPGARRGRAPSSAATGAATPRCSTPRWTASGPTSPARPGTARWSSPTRSWPGARRARASATSASAASALVPAAAFDGVDYAALGHLHGPQEIAPRRALQRLAAGATPSPRQHHRKGVWLVELDADGAGRARAVACPGARPLARVRGRLDDLLTDARWPPHEARPVR